MVRKAAIRSSRKCGVWSLVTASGDRVFIAYSVETAWFWFLSAACSVCQARVAHLTRAGNSLQALPTAAYALCSNLVVVSTAWALA